MSQWIRWWGLAVFVAIILFWWLAVDSIIKSAIESLGSKAVGARVELASADLQLAPLGLALKQLAVTNPELPMENLVIAETIELTLDSYALLGRKVIVEDMTATGLQFNTPRQRSGALAKKAKSDTDSGFSIRGALPGVKLPDPDALVDERKAAIQQEVDDIKQQLAAIEQKWTEKKQALPDKKTLDGYKQRWEDLKDANPLQRIAGIKQLRDDIKDDLKLIESLDEEFSQDMKTVQQQLRRARQLPAQQARQLLADAGLADGTAGFVRALFGDNIAKWLNRGMGLVKQVAETRPPAGQADSKPAKPPRGEGRWIEFASTDPLPDALLKRGQLSGQFPIAGQTLAFTGTLNDLTNQPRRWQNPATLALRGESPQGARLSIDGLFDHRQTTGKDSLEYQLTGLALSNIDLSSNDRLSLLLQQGQLDSKGSARLAGDQLQLDSNSQFAGLSLQPESRDDNKAIGMIANALAGVENFNLRVGANGPISSPQISVNSNLDNLLKQSLRGQLKDETAELKAQLQQRLETELQGDLGAIGEQAAALDQFRALLKEQKEQLSVIR